MVSPEISTPVIGRLLILKRLSIQDATLNIEVLTLSTIARMGQATKGRQG